MTPYWTAAVIIGCVAALGLFSVLLCRLDRRVEAELRLADEDQGWVSII